MQTGEVGERVGATGVDVMRTGIAFPTIMTDQEGEGAEGIVILLYACSESNWSQTFSSSHSLLFFAGMPNGSVDQASPIIKLKSTCINSASKTTLIAFSFCPHFVSLAIIK